MGKEEGKNSSSYTRPSNPLKLYSFEPFPSLVFLGAFQAVQAARLLPDTKKPPLVETVTETTPIGLCDI